MGHYVIFHTVPPAHTLVRWVDWKCLRLHSAGSTLPHLWPTGSQFRWPCFTTARCFSSSPSDSTSLWTPCLLMQTHQPPRNYPQIWIWVSQSKTQWDFNPPDERAATHALWPLLTPHDKSYFNQVSYSVSTCP